ncbi:MAG: hypothetical protein ABGX16_14985 [Pirellulales bacterium]
MTNSSLELHPAHYFKKITASANDLNPRPRAIYIGVGGDIDIENSDGSTEAAVPVVAGTTILCQFAKIPAISGATLYGLYG